MPKAVLLPLAVLLTVVPVGALSAGPEDPWAAWLVEQLGALPPVALVDGRAVPIEAALATLPPGGPRPAGVEGVEPLLMTTDVGIGVQDGSVTCSWGAWAWAAKRGSGPVVPEMLMNERVEPFPTGQSGTTCDRPWTHGVATVEVAPAAERFDACVGEAPKGAWLTQGEGGCLVNSYRTARMTGRVGFVDYFYPLGPDWVRQEFMYGGVPTAAPVGRAGADVATLAIAP